MNTIRRFHRHIEQTDTKADKRERSIFFISFFAVVSRIVTLLLLRFTPFLSACFSNNEIRVKSLFPRTQKDCIFFFFLTGVKGNGVTGTGGGEEEGLITSFTNRQTDGDGQEEEGGQCRIKRDGERE